jgi:hypothetical protein
MASPDPRIQPPGLGPVDASLSLLLFVQGLTLFVVIPFGATHPAGRGLLDLCHLTFAAVCVAVLTRHRAVQAALLGGLALLAASPILGQTLTAQLNLSTTALHETIAFIALAFNAVFTAVVARHVFDSGQVTAHRVRGAILLYLNVAALFAITYGLLVDHAPGAITHSNGGLLAAAPAAQTAELTYFSLTTITTTGYGDLAPMHPLARSLANLEAIFGQLFPATLLARLVALRLAHSETTPARRPRDDGDDDSG